MDSNWFPGCGRPHPNFMLITDWAHGNVKLVTVTRAGCVPIQQQYPSWSPVHEHEAVSASGVWIRAFYAEGNFHSATCRDGEFLRVERAVLEQYGIIEWRHDWIQMKPSRPQPRRGSGNELLSQKDLFKATPIASTETRIQ